MRLRNVTPATRSSPSTNMAMAKTKSKTIRTVSTRSTFNGSFVSLIGRGYHTLD